MLGMDSHEGRPKGMHTKKVTIVDVAKAAGVSIGAVSRILSNDPKLNVRAETRDSVHKIIAELGYTPNPQARGLRLSRTNSFAMIVPEINSPAFPAIIQGAQMAAQERGFSMLLGGVGENGEDPGLASRLLKKNRVDGFLISTGRREPEAMSELKTLRAPSVLLNRFLDDTHPHVILDDYQGAIAIVRHLLELGHRRIAFVGGLKRFLGTRRLSGYQAALQDAGISFDPDLAIDAGYDREGGEIAVHRLLALPHRPTAVFATNHLVAAGVLLGTQRMGLSVPADLSIASFYDGPVAELLNPALTAVRFPLERLGSEAALMLMDIIENRNVPTSKILPYDTIVVRGSTAAVPGTVRRVPSALRR